MGDVALGAGHRIILLKASGDETKVFDEEEPARPARSSKIFEDHLEEVVNRALFDDEAAFHIGFADRKRRVHHESNLSPFVGNARRNGGAAMIPEAIVTDIGVDQVKVTCRDEPIKDVAERAEHGSTKLTQG